MIKPEDKYYQLDLVFQLDYIAIAICQLNHALANLTPKLKDINSQDKNELTVDLMLASCACAGLSAFMRGMWLYCQERNVNPKYTLDDYTLLENISISFRNIACGLLIKPDAKNIAIH